MSENFKVDNAEAYETEGTTKTVEEVVEKVEAEMEAEVAMEQPLAEDAKPLPVIQLGMKEVTEIVDFGIAFGQAMEKSLEDDKVTIADLPNFMNSFIKLLPAMEGLSQARIELLAATPDDLVGLKAHIAESLELKDQDLEGMIQASIALVLDTWHLVNTYFVKHDEKTVSED